MASNNFINWGGTATTPPCEASLCSAGLENVECVFLNESCLFAQEVKVAKLVFGPAGNASEALVNKGESREAMTLI